MWTGLGLYSSSVIITILSAILPLGVGIYKAKIRYVKSTELVLIQKHSMKTICLENTIENIEIKTDMGDLT